MFGLKRRLVRTCECETDLPNRGPLPQISQTEAIWSPYVLDAGKFAPTDVGWRPAPQSGSLRRLADQWPRLKGN